MALPGPFAFVPLTVATLAVPFCSCRPSVVAVLGLHEGAPASAVAEALVGELRRDLTVATPGRLDAEGVLRAERGIITLIDQEALASAAGYALL